MTFATEVAQAAERLEDTFPSSKPELDAAELLRSVWMYEPKNADHAFALIDDIGHHEHHTDAAIQTARRVVHTIGR